MSIPTSLKWIADAIGNDAVNKLLIRYSGRRVYFPCAKHLTQEHELVGILGWDTAYKFCQTIQMDEDRGDRLSFAFRYTPEFRAERALIIKKMRALNFTKNEISLVFNLGVSQIFKIAKAESDNYTLKPRTKKAYCDGQLSLL